MVLALQLENKLEQSSVMVSEYVLIIKQLVITGTYSVGDDGVIIYKTRLVTYHTVSRNVLLYIKVWQSSRAKYEN